MLRKGLIEKLFEASHMQRWNDHFRPVELFELDKQAHKMIAAFMLGRFEEHQSGFSWIEIIEGGIFELLQRIVITDLKPPVFYLIKEDRDRYRRLNDWIYSQLENYLLPLGDDFASRFRRYFASDETSINRRVLGAAHVYSSLWEYRIIEPLNPQIFEIEEVGKTLEAKLEGYMDLHGLRELYAHSSYRKFLNLCGQLRFQYRWSNLHKVPKTSVLGHMLFVAILSYLFSLKIGACDKRKENNYFTGLFHDLPEVLTRDIISPVKSSVEGLKELISEYEREMMQREVYNLIPSSWHELIRLYTENEFEDVAFIEGRRTPASTEVISERYNEDRFSPRDGRLIKSADDLSAFVESCSAIENGNKSQDFQRVKVLLSEKYSSTRIGGLNIGEIYADFE